MVANKIKIKKYDKQRLVEYMKIYKIWKNKTVSQIKSG